MPPPTRVIIIGAGWSGLVAASTYLKISKHLDRPIDLTILDDGTTTGGVWEKDRLYPGLTANSPNGLYEYSHMSMVNDEHPYYELLPGTRVQEYLETYAKREGLIEKIRFGVHVKKVRRKGEVDGWVVEAAGGEKWECEKLIVATGLYSKARMPEIEKRGFEGVSIHSKELGKRQRELRDDESVRNVVVVGGCKSAVEACSLFLPHLNPEKKFKVSWVVRPSEHGVPMIVQDVDLPNNLVALGTTRLFSVLSPSIFWTTGFWYTIFHSGKFWPGLLLMELFWLVLSWAVKRDANYRSSENGRKIEPTGKSVFHDSSYVSLLPKKAPFLRYLHEDDEEILKVHRVTPTELTGREMLVVDEKGTRSRLPCDLVVWCTGWLPSVDFFEEGEARKLGLPVALVEDKLKTTAEQSLNSLPTTMLKPAAYWADGLGEGDRWAEREVIKKLPMLGKPAKKGYPVGYTGFRLYRQILPTRGIDTSDRSIVFAGLVSNGQTAMCCELTSLWAVAWMEGLLPRKSLPKSGAEAERNVELVSAWMRRRYGARGIKDPEIVLEIQSFFDLLCEDLGVDWARKKKGVKRSSWNMLGRIRDEVREWTTPYTGEDYKGIIEEFLPVENNVHL